MAIRPDQFSDLRAIAKSLLEDHGSFYKESSHLEQLFSSSVLRWQSLLIATSRRRLLGPSTMLTRALSSAAINQILLERNPAYGRRQRSPYSDNLLAFMSGLTTLVLEPSKRPAYFNSKFQNIYSDFSELADRSLKLVLENLDLTYPPKRGQSTVQDVSKLPIFINKLAAAVETGELTLHPLLAESMAEAREDFEKDLLSPDPRLRARAKLTRIYSDVETIMARGKSVNLFYYIDKDVLKDSLFEKMLKDKALEHHRFQEVEKSMEAMLYSIPDYQDFLKELVDISEPLQPKHLSIHKALCRLRDQVPEAFGYADAREDVSAHLSGALTSDAPLPIYADALKVLRSPEALAYGSFEQKERLEEELQEIEVALVLAAIDE